MEKLNILWTSDNKDTFFNMLALYTVNSKKKAWWEEVNVIIWGASAKLVAENEDVQAKVREMKENGVNVEACKVCSDNLGVTDKLIALGIDVKYMGAPLTEYLKSEEKIITI